MSDLICKVDSMGDIEAVETVTEWYLSIFVIDFHQEKVSRAQWGLITFETIYTILHLTFKYIDR